MTLQQKFAQISQYSANFLHGGASGEVTGIAGVVKNKRVIPCVYCFLAN